MLCTIHTNNREDDMFVADSWTSCDTFLLRNNGRLTSISGILLLICNMILLDLLVLPVASYLAISIV